MLYEYDNDNIVNDENRDENNKYSYNNDDNHNNYGYELMTTVMMLKKCTTYTSLSEF